MDLESVGAFLFCTLIVGVMIAIILGAIKYIKEARIDRVVYACDGEYKMNNVECVCGSDEVSCESSEILKKFFGERR